MKTKLFTIALLLTASLSGFAQDKTSLKTATLKMIDLTDHENYEDLMGTVYPMVFDIIPKDEYLDQQQKKLVGTDYKIHMIRIDPSIDYDAVKNVDNITFCLVNYTSMMTIELQNKVAPQDRTAKEDYFKKLLNTEEVFYIEENNTIDVKKRMHVVAIADDSTYGQWTFIDPETPGITGILHEAIQKALDPENTPEATVESDAQTEQYKAQKAEEEKKKSAQKKS